MKLLPRARAARLPAGDAPILVVTVDTEEEFDWTAGFFREKDTVESISGVTRFQQLCEEFGIRPTYFVDYPVATKRESQAVLLPIARGGGAELGAHLHPWVTPPHDEEPSNRLSFPGNLPADLEAAKLACLTEAIEQHFGIRPRSYRAGRYGIGPNTAGILEQLGYEVDSSIRARADLRADGGPDFRRCSNEPSWFGQVRDLLEVPVTAGYVGLLAGIGTGCYSWIRRAPGVLHLPGILSRLGLLAFIHFSPEGMSHGDHRRLVRRLRANGRPVLCFSLHSPSLRPGFTSYVRTEEQLDAFLDCCRATFGYLVEECGCSPMTMLELRRTLEQGDSASSPGVR